MIDTTIEGTSEFLITKAYQRFEEFCHACSREQYIGICYGTPGVGKTLSARYFAKQDLIESFRQENYTDETRVEMGKQIVSCRTLFYTAEVLNTPKRIEQDLNRALREHRSFIAKAGIELLGKQVSDNNRHELIIIDEADRLKVNSLEQVRDIYDRKKIGVVLIGMPGMEKRLARYPQLYSRVGFAHEFRAFGKKEIYFVLEYFWKKLGLVFDKNNADCIETVAEIINTTNGNFRLMVRLFSQIQRIMQINQLQTINQEVIQAARDCLVIGSI